LPGEERRIFFIIRSGATAFEPSGIILSIR
jgi:hypothetical protein